MIEISAYDKLVRLNALSPGILRDIHSPSLHEHHPRAAAALAEPPLLSHVRPDVLALLVGMADATVSEGEITCGDKVSEFIFREVGRAVGPATVERFQLMFVTRLLTFLDHVPDLVEPLFGLPSGEYARMAAEIDARADEETPPPFMRPLLIGKASEVLSLLAERPRLAELPPEFAHVFPVGFAQHELGNQPKSPHRFYAENLAQRVLDAIRTGPVDIETPVRVRLEVAAEVHTRRRFAKVHVLEFGWPELVRKIAMPGGPARLRDLERRVRDPELDTPLPPSWEVLLTDERLIEFLRLPPYLEDVSPVELADLLPEKPQLAVVSQDPIVTTPAYSDVVLTLTHIDQGPELVSADARLDIPGEQRFMARLEIPTGLVTAMTNNLIMAYQRSYGRRDTSADDLPERVLAQLGETLWGATFGAHKESTQSFQTVLNSNDRVRLVIRTDESQLASLPWECLRIPSLRVFAGLTLKLSVVREVPEIARLAPLRLTTPVRILVATANPSDARLPDLDAEVDLIRQIAEPAVRAGMVVLEVVQQATVLALEDTVRRFQPHIFHFAGHGLATEDDGGALVLVNEGGMSHSLPAERLGTLLQDYGILLAVLNACATAGHPVKAPHYGVGQNLVRQGVPAAVATTRDVVGNAALTFSRSFYRALLDGYAVESALTEGRKALSVRKWDWSSYVLYTGGDFPLDHLRIGS